MPRFIVAVALALAVLSGCSVRMPLRLYRLPSGSMIPTIPIGATMLVNQSAYMFVTARRGDIVVFTPPLQSADPFIKRIVAIPGDRFRMQRGSVYVNGRLIKENFISDPAAYNMVVRDYGIYVDEGTGQYLRLTRDSANLPPRRAWVAPDRLPPHCYIALGDNRNDSEDSHIWGCAQDSGSFWSGPVAGKPATFIGEVIKIYR